MPDTKTVTVHVDPSKETIIKPFGERMIEHAEFSNAGVTGSATGTSTNPPDSDGDGDVD